MKAVFLVRTGKSNNAFEFREVNQPVPGEGEVLIKVEASGINFADIVAREGMYRDAPPIPFIPGYEVVGKIVVAGNGVSENRTGERVTALTRFGGYAEYAV